MTQRGTDSALRTTPTQAHNGPLERGRSKTMVTERVLARTATDAVALEPREATLSRVTALSVDAAVDYEGQDHLPDADGFDPPGDGGPWSWVLDGVGRILVAGNPAYLIEAEQGRAVAPRLGAARERPPREWVGTESVERLREAGADTVAAYLSRGLDAFGR